jgi:hypothetical protein
MTSSDVTFHPESPAANCLWCPGRMTAPRRLPFAKSAECFLSTHETTAFPNGIDVYRWLCEASRRAQHLPRARRERLSTIDEAQIKAFAREFEPQPFHLDNKAAKDTLFAGLAASGWHNGSRDHASAGRVRPAPRRRHCRSRRRTHMAEADPARRHSSVAKRGIGDHAIAIPARSRRRRRAQPDAKST